MSSLITGNKAQHSDAEIIWEFNESLNGLGNRGNNFILAQLPCLRFLPGKFRTLYGNCITFKARDRLLHGFYYTHGDESCALRKEAGGLLAAFIQMQAKMNQQAGYEVVRDLRGLMIDVFFGGLDTTLAALINSSALLLEYPECKAKICSEIDRVIGKARPPSLDDRKHMPYTKAF